MPKVNKITNKTTSKKPNKNAEVNRKSKHRGATRLESEKKAKEGRKFEFDFDFTPIKQFFKRVAIVCLLVAVCAGGVFSYQFVGKKTHIPLSNVVVSGELYYVDKNQIGHVLAEHKNLNFFNIDLTQIKQDLERLPWVYQAQVKRQWPNKLAIQVEEEKAIALWGSSVLINHQGELFEPKQGKKPQGLPVLHGTQGSEVSVMRHYELLSHLLGEMGLRIQELSMDSRGSIEMTLHNGIALKVGEGAMVEKIQRFSSAFSLELFKHTELIKAIDLRYTNGVAVNWKAEKPNNKNKRVGA